MNARIMKYIGIVVMLVAHPVGYFFWHFVILGPFAYDVDYPFEVSGIFPDRAFLVCDGCCL